MILTDPYKIGSLKYKDLGVIKNHIKKYIILDYSYIKMKNLINISNFGTIKVYSPVILYGFSNTELDIEPFHHPLIDEENGWIALDLRNLIKVDRNNFSFEIRNEAEFNLTLIRFILTGLWLTEERNQLTSLVFPHIVFSTWISDNLTKRFGLDLVSQANLKALSFIYYYTLFKDSELTEEDISKLYIKAKSDFVVQDVITEVGSKIDSLNSIDDFCRNVFSVTNNLRLKGFDYTVLLNTLINSWFGSNAKELVMLSLEHPPTFISLVYNALIQRNFKKTVIGQIVDKKNKRGSGDLFIKELSTIIKTKTGDNYV